ncbi:DUF4124 domain-containing protein [Solimicrobium silvestre]|uniref:DUF4124 domain-containing protein n=1 Tax=Solimicrobium silvestre TaxID=2099400 RepID=A0A2S9GV27_9BURK|nr:DUF4124 domain-containing protein [Solimicrobium silvestre]PRC91564.1 hypothetical protein S2091_3680 [Solimicrobium silvestre]
MTKTQLQFLPILFVLHLASAHADIYSCKDSAGHMITSDRPIPECANRSTQIYGNNGSLKQEFAAELTPEQKRAAELKEQQRVKEAQQQEQLKKEQRYLIAHYPNEQSVEIARHQAVDVLEAKIKVEKHLIEVTTAALNKNREEQLHIPQNQTNKIIAAQNQEDDLAQTIEHSEHLIHNYQIEEIKINLQFDETHRRYLEIVAPSKK